MKKVYIEENESYVECALFDGEEFLRFLRLDKNFHTGSIVLGKVIRVKSQVGVFVDIGLDREGILPYRPNIKVGDMLLTMIETEPSEERGCSLTEHITLGGKYLVYLSNEEYKFSREISEERKIELFGVSRPKQGGFIFRSLCMEGSLTEIEEEGKKLAEKYAEILLASKNCQKITYFYRPNAMDVACATATEVEYGFEKIRHKIDELQERKVCRNGVELVFDRTEAMTVVDVNFHRFDSSGKKAIFDADCIAVQEFARQIRLRNIGGIIVLDYISLVSEEERKALFDVIHDEFKKDFVRSDIEHVERAGLFVITRQKRFSSIF